jgi:hypothetical protein
MNEIPQYFAQIDNNNIVLQVHVVGQLFLEENPDRYSGTWVETFINLPNKTYAGIGYTYNAATQDFIAPEPVIPEPIEP